MSEKRGRGALDVESVLANVSSAFLARYNEQNGTNIALSDWKTWNFVNLDYDVETFIEKSEDIWKSDWKSIPACEDSLDATVQRLTDQYNIDIVTSRAECDEEIKSWLDHYGIRGWDNFVVVPYSESKSDYNYDFYIDDKPMLARESNMPVYLVRHLYNMEVQSQDAVIPVRSVREAVDLLTLDYIPVSHETA